MAQTSKSIKGKFFPFIASLLLSSIYLFIFYLVLNYQLKLDFTTFYSANLALRNGHNPYGILVADYLPMVRTLSTNLNPPFFLWLCAPLLALPYSTALIIWVLFSFILGFIGARLAFQYAFPEPLVKKYQWSLFLIYFALFSTLMNTATTQFGAVLLFFTMLGYHYFQSQKNWLAGITWGIIIAIKLFPALLLFYVLKQRRFKVFMAMILTLLVCTLIPALVYGIEIYQQYYIAMSHIIWSADSWNASVYGFLFRCFSDTYQISKNNIFLLNLTYLMLFIGIMYWYWKFKEDSGNNHYLFSITLLLMLFLSPLGWMYYFSILVLPLALSYGQVVVQKSKGTWWLLSFFLINFPVDYVRITNMHGFLNRITFYSAYFYGLLLLLLLIVRENNIRVHSEKEYKNAISEHGITVLIILGLGIFVSLVGFVTRLMS